MQARLFLFIFSTLLVQNIHAQLISKTIGAQCASVAQIGTVNINGFEVFNNPAGVAVKNETCLSFYQELPYFQKSLQLSAISYQRPFKYFASGLGLIQSGNEYFSQQLFSVGIAKKLTDHLYLGTGLNYLRTQQFQLSTINNLYSSLGLYIRLKTITIGSSIININRSSYHTEKKELLGTSIKLGFSYQLNESFIFLAENASDLSQNNQSKLGIDYKINESFHLYGGWKNNPQLLSFGSGYLHNKTRFIIGASHHRELGLTPFVEFQFSFFKN